MQCLRSLNSEARIFPDGHASFNFPEVPLGDFESFPAVGRGDEKVERRFPCGHETGAVFDPDAVFGEAGEAFAGDLAEGFLGHWRVDGIFDSRDGAVILGIPDGPGEVDMRTAGGEILDGGRTEFFGGYGCMEKNLGHGLIPASFEARARWACGKIAHPM